MPVRASHGTAMTAKIIPIRPSPGRESNDLTRISFAHLKCCHRLSTQPHFISTKKPDLDPEVAGLLSAFEGLIASG